MKTKLLLLEDDLTLNETVVEYFEDEGYEIVSVYDGDDALSAIYENSFDLLLLDVNVPSLNGFKTSKPFIVGTFTSKSNKSKLFS